MNKSTPLGVLLAGTTFLTGCTDCSFSSIPSVYSVEVASLVREGEHPIISARRGLYEGYFVETAVIGSWFPMNGETKRMHCLWLSDLSRGKVNASIYAGTYFGEPVSPESFKISSLSRNIPAGHPFEQITPRTLQKIYQAMQPSSQSR